MTAPFSIIPGVIVVDSVKSCKIEVATLKVAQGNGS